MPTSPVTSSDDPPPSDDCITPANDLIIKLPTSITSPGKVKTAANAETTQVTPVPQPGLIKERASPALPSNDSSKQVNTSPVFLPISNCNSSSSPSSPSPSSPSPPVAPQYQQQSLQHPPSVTVSSSSSSLTSSSSHLTTNSLVPSSVTTITTSSSNHPTSTSSSSGSCSFLFQANSDMTHITNISDDDLTDQQEKDFVNNINDIKKQVETAAPSSPSTTPVAAVLLSSNSIAPESTVSQGIRCFSSLAAASLATVTATPTDLSSSSSPSSYSNNNKLKQIHQLQRFLSTLQSFACDLSPEIGHAVRSLIIALSTSSVSVDEFAQRVQEVTRYPLRSFVLPFLRLHVPHFQYELRQLASKLGITLHALLAKSPSPLFDFTNFIFTLEQQSPNKPLSPPPPPLHTPSVHCHPSLPRSTKESRSCHLEPFEIFLPPLPPPNCISVNSIVPPSCNGANSPTFQPPVGSPHDQLPIVVPSSQASLLTIPASVFSSQGTIANTRPASDTVARLSNFYHPSILSHLSLQSNNVQENHYKSPRLLPNSYNLTTCPPVNMGIKDLPVKRRLSSPPDSRKENELHPPTPNKRVANLLSSSNSRSFPVNGLNQSNISSSSSSTSSPSPSSSVPGSNQLNHLHQQSLHFLHSTLHPLSKTQHQQQQSLTTNSTSSMVKQTTTTTTTSMNCNDHHHRQGQGGGFVVLNNNKQSTALLPTGDKLPANAGASPLASGCHRKESNESDEEWQNIHTMLNCIRGMVDKTMKAIAILQMRSMEQTTALPLVVTSNSGGGGGGGGGGRTGTSGSSANSIASNGATGLPSASNGKTANTSEAGSGCLSSSSSSTPPSSSIGSMAASSASQHMMTCAVSSLATAGPSALFSSSPSLVQYPHPHHQRSNHVTVAAGAVSSSPTSSSCSSSSLTSSPSPPSSTVTASHSHGQPMAGMQGTHYHGSVHHQLASSSSSSPAAQLMKLASGVKQSTGLAGNNNAAISVANSIHHLTNGTSNNGLLSISTAVASHHHHHQHQHLLEQSSGLNDKPLGHLSRALGSNNFDAATAAAVEAKRLTVHKTPTAESSSNSSTGSMSGVGGLGGGSTASATVNASDLIQRTKLELLLSQAVMRRQAVAAFAREDSSSKLEMTVNPENCWNCGREANERCSGCNVAKYCSYFCQHKDWESHHKMCGISLYAEPNRHLAKVSEVNLHKSSPSTSNMAPAKSVHRTSSPISVKSPLHPLDHSNKAIHSHSPDLPVGKSTSPLASAKINSPSALQLNNE